MVEKCVMQPWMFGLPMMQQTVLLTAIRGADGLTKYHPAKYVQRWFRRCTLRCSFGGMVFDNPGTPGGGSFTGPVPQCQTLRGDTMVQIDNWELFMDNAFGEYLSRVDEVPHHFHLHIMHASEILGYHHPDARIRSWWNKTYLRMVNDMHLQPETQEELDTRLSDSHDEWWKRNDESTAA